MHATQKHTASMPTIAKSLLFASDMRAKARASLRSLVALVSSLALVSEWHSCFSRDPHDSAADSTKLVVDFAGCASVLEGPTCEIAPQSRLFLWVPTQAAVSFRTNGPAPTVVSRTPMGPGLQFLVKIPGGATYLELSTDSASRPWRLTLAQPRQFPWLNEARSLRAQGNLPAAVAVLRVGLAADDPAARALATGMSARVALMQGHIDSAIDLFRQAIALDRQSGILSQETNDSSALAYVLSNKKHDTLAARRVLDESSHAFSVHPEATADDRYSRGLIAYNSGDVRSALRLLEEAKERADRLGMEPTARSARTLIALQLAFVGRSREATALLHSIAEHDAPDVPPCDHALVLLNLSLGVLIDRYNQERPASREALPILDKAIAIYKTTCPSPQPLALALLAAAEANVQDGQLSRARQLIDQARSTAATPTGESVAWSFEVEGHLAMAERKPELALRNYEREAELGRRMGLREALWRGTVGAAEALEALGRDQDAIGAYAEAEAIVDDASLWVPLGEGRGAFLADRERSARLLVEVLVRTGTTEKALAAARAARSRMIASVARSIRIEHLSDTERARWDKAVSVYRSEREAARTVSFRSWQWPEDQYQFRMAQYIKQDATLRQNLEEILAANSIAHDNQSSLTPPKPNETILAYYPGARHWFVFASDDRGTQAASIDLPALSATPQQVADALLRPVKDKLSAAKSLRILPSGPLQRLDFHALPWNGRPLIAHAVVTYGLDIGDGTHPSQRTSGSALVLANPFGDLPAVAQEANIVQSALQQYGWRVSTLGPAASASEVRQAILAASLLHYAGHGEFRGREGWESFLRLGDEAQIPLGDILTLGAAPANVVLSACDAARLSDDSSSGVSFGVAQAFTIAGSEAVVAAARPVKDAFGAAMAGPIYRSFSGESRGDLARALRDAQLRMIAEGSPEDWAAYRVLVR